MGWHWLWLSWFSVRFRHQESTVQIPTLKFFYQPIAYLNRKDRRKEKEAGNGSSLKKMPNLQQAVKTFLALGLDKLLRHFRIFFNGLINDLLDPADVTERLEPAFGCNNLVQIDEGVVVKENFKT